MVKRCIDCSHLRVNVPDEGPSKFVCSASWAYTTSSPELAEINEDVFVSNRYSVGCTSFSKA